MSDSNAPWSVWFDRTGAKAKCSTCGREIDKALVFPEHGLNVCFSCLNEMQVAAETAEKEKSR